jgi:hypothetical protein
MTCIALKVVQLADRYDGNEDEWMIWWKWKRVNDMMEMKTSEWYDGNEESEWNDWKRKKDLEMELLLRAKVR